MKRPESVVSTVCAVLLCWVVVAIQMATAEEAPVLAQDLHKSLTPGKVAAVLWTARNDYCTLQVVFPNSSRIVQALGQSPKLKPQRVQIWLLREDGSIILPLWRSPDPGATKPATPRNGLPDVTFRFPSSANGEAVAAVIRIDDDFQVEKLQHLGN